MQFRGGENNGGEIWMIEEKKVTLYRF